MSVDTEYSLAEDEDTSLIGDYAICDQCEWNGVPNQRIIIVYRGIRPANEPGFVHKFETYNCSRDGTKEVHRHKYDPVVIDHIVGQTFARTKRFGE